jgi:cobalt/nickel transport protein
MKKNMTKINIILLMVAIILTAIPFAITKNKDIKETDKKVEVVIKEKNKENVSWFESLLKMPPKEVKNLLFTLEVAIGIGFICFYIGFTIGKKKNTKPEEKGNYKTTYCSACKKIIDDSVTEYFEAGEKKDKKSNYL